MFKKAVTKNSIVINNVDGSYYNVGISKYTDYYKGTCIIYRFDMDEGIKTCNNNTGLYYQLEKVLEKSYDRKSRSKIRSRNT